MTESVEQHWQLRKAAITSDKGLVATQHYLASDIGADVLRRGGNAIDAAIAAGLALGVVEPWMSGIGGGGYMTVFDARTRRTQVVEFGMRAPLESTAADYPLAGAGANASDAFNWPKVIDDTNIHGPKAVAVPGYLKGLAKALDNFGTWDWADLIEPACVQAEAGLPIDWFSAQKINQFARGLRLYETTRETYLADGLPPVANIDGSLERLRLGRLAGTYRYLQQHGPEAFYQGELADSIAEDLANAGSRITTVDLADYEANIASPLTTEHRDATLNVSGPLTAGPSIIRALNEFASRTTPGGATDGGTYEALAQALFTAYADRLANLGEGSQGNTSHIAVADAAGNVVSLTQTIMSAFGARIMLPESGILMNNGMMWFDPTPGGPNSVLGGRRPLCNMCPVILEGPGDTVTAIGACGGRRIFPAVFQLVVFMTDYGMSVDDAIHHPRIDVSGTELVTLMEHAAPEIRAHLEATFGALAVRPNGVNPNLFALPQVVRFSNDGISGGCFIPSPHAKVSAA